MDAARSAASDYAALSDAGGAFPQAVFYGTEASAAATPSDVTTLLSPALRWTPLSPPRCCPAVALPLLWSLSAAPIGTAVVPPAR
jgi:hypothetical protein